jgi:hypothetical protein
LHFRYLGFSNRPHLCHGDPNVTDGVGRLTLPAVEDGIITGILWSFRVLLLAKAFFSCVVLSLSALLDYPLVFHFSLGDANRRGCSCIFSPAHGPDSLAPRLRPIVSDQFFSTILAIACGPTYGSPDARILHHWLLFCIIEWGILWVHTICLLLFCLLAAFWA